MILYTHPDNAPEFERRYLEDYAPLVRRLPGVSQVSFHRVEGAPLGEPPYYRLETWRLLRGVKPETVVASPDWRAAQDVLRFARGLSTMMYVEEEAASG